MELLLNDGVCACWWSEQLLRGQDELTGFTVLLFQFLRSWQREAVWTRRAHSPALSKLSQNTLWQLLRCVVQDEQQVLCSCHMTLTAALLGLVHAGRYYSPCTVCFLCLSSLQTVCSTQQSLAAAGAQVVEQLRLCLDHLLEKCCRQQVQKKQKQNASQCDYLSFTWSYKFRYLTSSLWQVNASCSACSCLHREGGLQGQDHLSLRTCSPQIFCRNPRLTHELSVNVVYML